MTQGIDRMAEHLNQRRAPRAPLKAPATVPIALVSGMLMGLQMRGEDIGPFLNATDISPELIGHAGARVTACQYSALFRLLIEQREDEGLGFLSRPLKLGSFALISRSALGANNLEVAIRRIARTFWLLQEDVALELHSKGNLAGLGLRFNGSLGEPIFLHELLLRVFWRLLAWLIGGRLPVVRFDFAFDNPPHAGSYGKVFPAHLEFKRGQTALWFEAAWLKTPVRRGETELRLFLADAQANIIMPRSSTDVVSARVREYLQRTRPSWPDLGITARALHMSTATLQRRLAMEGTSFQSLKDELRRDMAIIRLNAHSMSFAELAQELGFKDSAAFQRAFKGWTGVAPGAFRQGRFST